MGRARLNNEADRKLVQRILEGHTHEFGMVIKNTEGLVAQIIFKMVSNGEDRKDLVQDVYLKAFKGLAKFRFRSKLSTWIGQIAYNTCLNYLEKNRPVLIERTDEEEKTEEETLDLLNNNVNISYNNEIEKFIHRKELSVILKKEIEKLTPVYRTLITLYHNEEMTYAQIGEVAQLPEGTVKNYLYRARKEIKKNLLAKFEKHEL